MSTSPTVWTSRRIGLWFVGFFGFIALVNAGMVTVALRTHSGLVTDHAYEKGLAYNTTIAQSNAQAALGWQPNLQLTQGATRNQQHINFSLHDHRGAPIAITQAHMVWMRPTASGEDVAIDLSPTPNQQAVADIVLPEAGLWDVTIEARTATHAYQHHQRIVLQ